MKRKQVVCLLLAGLMGIGCGTSPIAAQGSIAYAAETAADATVAEAGFYSQNIIRILLW